MPGRVTLWGAGELLKTTFSRTAEVPPAFHLALILGSPPTPFVSGSELDEPDLPSYQRVEIPNDIAHWDNTSQLHVVTLNADVSFVPAAEDWGTIRYWALCNASVDGYVYFAGSLEEPIEVLESDIVVLKAGDLSFSLGPFFSEES